MNNKLREILLLCFGWTTLIVGLAFLFLGLYMLPAVIFGIDYEMPNIIIHFNTYLYTTYGLTGIKLKLAGLIPFLISGVGLLLMSSYISFLVSEHRADELKPNPKITVPEEIDVTQNLADRPREKIHPLIKILVGFVIIFLLIKLAEYLITSEFLLKLR